MCSELCRSHRLCFLSCVGALLSHQYELLESRCVSVAFVRRGVNLTASTSCTSSDTGICGRAHIQCDHHVPTARGGHSHKRCACLRLQIEVFHELHAAVIEAVKKGEACQRTSYFETPEERLLMMAVILHTADIANAAKPWHIAER